MPTLDPVPVSTCHETTRGTKFETLIDGELSRSMASGIKQFGRGGCSIACVVIIPVAPSAATVRTRRLAVRFHVRRATTLRAIGGFSEQHIPFLSTSRRCRLTDCTSFATTVCHRSSLNGSSSNLACRDRTPLSGINDIEHARTGMGRIHCHERSHCGYSSKRVKAKTNYVRTKEICACPPDESGPITWAA